VFFGSDDGRLYALNKTTGGLGWSFSPGYVITEKDANNYLTTPILSDPIVKDGVVYVGIKGMVYALDAQTIESTENKVGIKGTSIDLLELAIYLAVSILLILLIVRIYVSIKKRGK
jgi:outer membrane protein assembly factor BamB